MDQSLLAAGELGNYIDGFKLLPVFLVSLGWLKLMTWVDKDAHSAHLPRETVNLINLGGWVLAIGVMLLLPNIWAAIAVFLFFFCAEIAYYLIWRNQTVGLSDLSGKIKAGFANLGKKKGSGEVKATEGGVVVMDKSGKPLLAPIDEDPIKPAFDALQSFLQGPMKLRAQRIDLRPVEGGSVQRYTVDGMTFEGKSFPRDIASSMVELTKSLAGMDIADKRKPQTGKIRINTDQSKHDVDVYTAGSTAGEMLKLQVDAKKQTDYTVDTLGFLKDQYKLLTDVVSDPGGVVLLTAPEGQGLTNLCYAILRKHDAFLTQILTLERDQRADLEGIRHNVLPASAPPADESKQIEWMVSQEPDIIYIDRIDDPRSAIDLAKYAKGGKRAYVAMRTGTAFDALAQWRKLVGDDELAMSSLKLVIAERLVRVLCTACKIAYTPDPDALRKMNMAADRVDKLFQARKEPMRDQKGNEVICPFCHGLAYVGRTGVFEMFSVDDEVRKAVLSGGTINQLKSLFRKQRQRYLQESALARVELGDTSVEEVLRVLRTPGSSHSRSQSSSK